MTLCIFKSMTISLCIFISVTVSFVYIYVCDYTFVYIFVYDYVFVSICVHTYHRLVGLEGNHLQVAVAINGNERDAFQLHAMRKLAELHVVNNDLEYNKFICLRTYNLV